MKKLVHLSAIFLLMLMSLGQLVAPVFAVGTSSTTSTAVSSSATSESAKSTNTASVTSSTQASTGSSKEVTETQNNSSLDKSARADPIGLKMGANNFFYKVDTPYNYADGYTWGTRTQPYYFIPGVSAQTDGITFDVRPYWAKSYLQGTNSNGDQYQTSPSQISPFYLSLPKFVHVDSSGYASDVAALQAALNKYYTSLKSMGKPATQPDNGMKNLTGFDVKFVQTKLGHDIYLITPKSSVAGKLPNFSGHDYINGNTDNDNIGNGNLPFLQIPMKSNSAGPTLDTTKYQINTTDVNSDENLLNNVLAYVVPVRLSGSTADTVSNSPSDYPILNRISAFDSSASSANRVMTLANYSYGYVFQELPRDISDKYRLVQPDGTYVLAKELGIDEKDLTFTFTRDESGNDSYNIVYNWDKKTPVIEKLNNYQYTIDRIWYETQVKNYTWLDEMINNGIATAEYPKTWEVTRNIVYDTDKAHTDSVKNQDPTRLPGSTNWPSGWPFYPKPSAAPFTNDLSNGSGQDPNGDFNVNIPYKFSFNTTKQWFTTQTKGNELLHRAGYLEVKPPKDMTAQTIISVVDDGYFDYATNTDSREYFGGIDVALYKLKSDGSLGDLVSQGKTSTVADSFGTFKVTGLAAGKYRAIQVGDVPDYAKLPGYFNDPKTGTGTVNGQVDFEIKNPLGNYVSLPNTKREGKVIIQYVDRRTNKLITDASHTNGTGQIEVSAKGSDVGFKHVSEMSGVTDFLTPQKITGYTPIDQAVTTTEGIPTTGYTTVEKDDPVIGEGTTVYTYRYEPVSYSITTSNWNFGKWPISSTDKNYYLPAAKDDKGNKVPNSVKVTDYYGTDNWTLSVKQDGQLRAISRAGGDTYLTGAKLSATNLNVTNDSKDSLGGIIQKEPSFSVTTNFELDPNATTATNILTMTKKKSSTNTGGGHYAYGTGYNNLLPVESGGDAIGTSYDNPAYNEVSLNFGTSDTASSSVKLFVPGDAAKYKALYKTKLQWQLTVAP